MKHLKYFESSFFNPGDIIILDDSIVPNVGVILDIVKHGEFESSNVYTILLHNNKKISVGIKKIKHFPTPWDTDEIKDMVEQMAFIVQATKYNL